MNGVVWEVFREDDDKLAAVLEWGHRAVSGKPSLIFTSTEGMRRLAPCPDSWNDMSDETLLVLLRATTELY